MVNITPEIVKLLTEIEKFKTELKKFSELLNSSRKHKSKIIIDEVVWTSDMLQQKVDILDSQINDKEEQLRKII